MRSITEINGIIVAIKKYLLNVHGAGIKQVIVYGSFARGEATEDSDVDLLVVVDDELDPLEVEESLNDFLFKILLEEGELISIMAIPERIFKGYNSPFLINAREEGTWYSRLKQNSFTALSTGDNLNYTKNILPKLLLGQV